MKSLVLAHRHLTVRHALGENLALLARRRDHRRLQGRIETLLGAVAGPDEGRQPAQLQEFTHHPHTGRAPQRNREVRGQDQAVQPPHPSGVRTNAAKAAGASSIRTGLHQSCRVLRATPRSAATCRCVRPTANRAPAASSCSARSRRERRFTTAIPPAMRHPRVAHRHRPD